MTILSEKTIFFKKSNVSFTYLCDIVYTPDYIWLIQMRSNKC